ncbi:hypothetical protein [Glaesserella sp.]|uniref:hypothetical protein n=1 Tax=Glaesserella sp. TaxID=2094731 RepID=UPI0035A16244
MTENHRYKSDMIGLSFIEKIQFILNLLEQGAIEELEAYQLITMEEPKAVDKPEQIGTIEFF